MRVVRVLANRVHDEHIDVTQIFQILLRALRNFADIAEVGHGLTAVSDDESEADVFAAMVQRDRSEGNIDTADRPELLELVDDIPFDGSHVALPSALHKIRECLFAYFVRVLVEIDRHSTAARRYLSHGIQAQHGVSVAMCDDDSVDSTNAKLGAYTQYSLAPGLAAVDEYAVITNAQQSRGVITSVARLGVTVRFRTYRARIFQHALDLR